MTFELHPRLAADTFPVGALPLCRVLLMNDSNWPWCVLVPERSGIREIHALPAEDQRLLMQEISGVSAAMETAFGADKINIGALGNIVPQLHVHVIARFETDPAWPAPVWGRLPASPYAKADRDQRLAALGSAFARLSGFHAEPA